MYLLRRSVIIVFLIVASYFGLSALRKHFDPSTSQPEDDSEDVLWIATSKHWLDRLACRWLSLCGLTHWHPDPAANPWRSQVKRVGASSLMKLLEDNDEFGGEFEEKDTCEKLQCHGEQSRTSEWDKKSRSNPELLKEVPQYVIDYAPLIHLYSNEYFWPSDIMEHLKHTTAYLNHTTFNLSSHRYTPYDLHKLNEGYDGNHIFMHSRDDVEERPDWLGSAYNKPIPYDDNDNDDDDNIDNFDKKNDNKLEKTSTNHIIQKDESFGHIFSEDPYYNSSKRKVDLRRSQMHHPSLTKRHLSPPKLSSSKNTTSGYSRAPSILIIVEKGPEIVDAFWFYFYSYNLGTTVFNIRFGNHVGDWEHSLIRFQKGKPVAIFLSAHSGGLAYDWKAVEKGKGKGKNGRPILYSAVGSHAMYATPGRHPYILPFGLLADVTDSGPLWDPALNYLAYHYNTSITHNADARSTSSDLFTTSTTSDLLNLTKDEYGSFQPAACNPSAPVGWWWYAGRWGDKFYELRDWRQWRFVGQYHYVNGPFGPRFKNLGRAKVCQSGPICRIVKRLSDARSWIGRYH